MGVKRIPFKEMLMRDGRSPAMLSDVFIYGRCVSAVCSQTNFDLKNSSISIAQQLLHNVSGDPLLLKRIGVDGEL